MEFLPKELLLWRSQKFDQNHVSLTAATDSIDNKTDIVQVRKTKSASRWNIHPVGSTSIATFAHSAIWYDGTPPQTGNYVRHGTNASKSIPVDKIQREISYKCEVTYTFDTKEDKSLYNNLAVIESLALNEEGISHVGRPRRTWQSGIQDRFQMTSQLFMNKAPWNENAVAQNKIPYDLHPDILDAVENSNEYVPTITEPARFLAWEGGQLIPLKDSVQPDLVRGDIVAISFTVAFVVGKTYWWPEISPHSIVKVHRPEVVKGGHINHIPVQLKVTPLALGRVAVYNSKGECAIPASEAPSVSPSTSTTTPTSQPTSAPVQTNQSVPRGGDSNAVDSATKTAATEDTQTGNSDQATPPSESDMDVDDTGNESDATISSWSSATASDSDYVNVSATQVGENNRQAAVPDEVSSTGFVGLRDIPSGSSHKELRPNATNPEHAKGTADGRVNGKRRASDDHGQDSQLGSPSPKKKPGKSKKRP
ncbi:hypothetical protein PLICRDRAFT_171548 [Plicaturopsis crispa FD-325 SS-3]|nr:hypothetical protein PLICRDRAFT_171548 [Plicaturopsis crispa FD-325 SS-3]